MLGLVAVASLALVIVAMEATTTTEQETEQELVEQSFVELSQSLATQAGDSDIRRSVNFEAGEHGAIARESTGEMVVTGETMGEVEFEIGTIEWQGDDGTTVAYQGGAVFRETGQETQLLSSPSINYDRSTETLTMPIMTVTGDDELRSGPIDLAYHDHRSVNKVARMDEENVEIRVESEYYLGWKEYFERQAGDTIVTGYGEIEDDYGYVVAELGYLEFDDAFEDGVSYASECDGQGSHPCDDLAEVSQGGPFEPLDDVVYAVINDPEEVSDDGSGFDRNISEEQTRPTEIEDEYVLIQGDLAEEDIEVDLSEGNATVAVDGDMWGTNITVTDRADDNTLQLYLNGSFASDGGNVCLESCDSLDDGTVIQLFGTSETAIQFGPGGGSPKFEGLIYAASDEDSWDHVYSQGQCDEDANQLCVQASPDIHGSIIVESVDLQGELNVTHDPAIDSDDVDFREELLPPQLTYMNMVEHTLRVEND